MRPPSLGRNLKELRQRLEEYAATNGIAVSSPTPEAELMSQSLPLAHSTTGEALSDICGCGQILSTERVAASRGTSLKADSAEGQLGTAVSSSSTWVHFVIQALAAGCCCPKSGGGSRR